MSLIQTVEHVRSESQLHTAAIQAQLAAVHELAEELTHMLGIMKSLQHRSKMYQGLYMLVKRSRDEGRLNDVLVRLGRAKTELGLRIDVVHVGLTGGVRMGIERLEQGMMARDGAVGESGSNFLLLGHAQPLPRYQYLPLSSWILHGGGIHIHIGCPHPHSTDLDSNHSRQNERGVESLRNARVEGDGDRPIHSLIARG